MQDNKLINKSVVDLVLLVNLGSPLALNKWSIAKFLSKFLSDKRVVALPRIFWLPLLHVIIIPLRLKRLLNKYSLIWHENNLSPLVHYTKEQARLLQIKFNDNKDHLSSEVIVRAIFSYNKPNISGTLKILHKIYQINKLYILPLFPQYSSTTTAVVFDQIANYYKRQIYIPHLIFMNNFASQQHYITAIINKINTAITLSSKKHINTIKNIDCYDKIIFSYHSLPLNIIKKQDPYRDQCYQTTALLAQSLSLHVDKVITTFASKFGYNKWLQPSTTNTLRDLASNHHIKKILIVCPGFVSDCLETIEEINIINRNVFMQHGGTIYDYVDCLNDDNEFIDALYNIILRSDKIL